MLQPIEIQNVISQLPRTQWSVGTRSLDSITKLIVHHEGTPNGAFFEGDTAAKIAYLQRIAQYQINNHAIDPAENKGSDGADYHYYVFADGSVFQLRELTDILWADSNMTYNNDAIAICLDGNFDLEAVPDAQRLALESLVHMLSFYDHDHFQELHNINTADGQSVFGHGEVALSGTQCPGTNLLAIVKQDRESRLQSAIDFFHAHTPQPTEPTQPTVQGASTVTNPSNDVQTLQNELATETQLEQTESQKLADAIAKLSGAVTDQTNTKQKLDQLELAYADLKKQDDEKTKQLTDLEARLNEVENLHVTDTISHKHNVDVLQEIQYFFEMLYKKVNGGESGHAQTNPTTTNNNQQA